ncbi:MAG: protein kinase, partial [Dehalococcoidia bacterium]
MAVKSALAHVSEQEITREAEVWMELGLHPNIVSCYFVRNLGGIPRIFVEYVEAGTLQEWLYGEMRRNEVGTEPTGEKPRELTRAQRLGIAIGICRGMQHAHTFAWTDRSGAKQVGLVHRDLKPLNILLTSDGVPRITDFGLVGFGPASRKARPQEAAPAGELDATLVKSISGEGGLVGTPAYAAPEQWNSRGSVGKAADIYAFGVILYELFCGRRPFVLPQELRHAVPELKQAEYERMHCQQEPPDPASLVPDIDSELSALMVRCLSKNPEDRGNRPGRFAELGRKLKTIYKRLEYEDYDDLRPEPKPTDLLADSLNNRALSYFEIGQPNRAEESWAKALKADPHHPESTYNRGVFLWRAARMTDDELVRQMEEVRRSHEDTWVDEYLLALVHLERGDCSTAIHLLQELVDSDYASAETRTTLNAAKTRLVRSRRLLRTFRGHSGSARSLWLSPDAARALSVSADNKTLRLWDTQTGQSLRAFSAFTSNLSLVRVSADGSLALLAGSDQNAPIGQNAWTLVDRVKVWDLNRDECVRSFQFRARDLALSPDGKYFLSVSDGQKPGGAGEIRLWDLATGSFVMAFDGHSGSNCIGISPDGAHALGGAGRTL